VNIWLFQIDVMIKYVIKNLINFGKSLVYNYLYSKIELKTCTWNNAIFKQTYTSRLAIFTDLRQFVTNMYWSRH